MGWAFYLVIFSASLYAINALTPKPPTERPASLKDIDIPTAEPGRPIPVIFGTVKLTGVNIVWYGDLASSPVRVKASEQ